ncbi:NAD-dependent epimerase/dehydratase family protein [candidate division KSB1 bacterium]|nr:NAD-dependent epimerase/dehydratase family protein [candidate division KSB1 bacterium]
MDINFNTFIIQREEPILVTGANGFVGSKVVQTLLDYGLRKIKCLSRPTSTANRLDSLQKQYGEKSLEIVKGNLLSRETCAAATNGISVIYHLAAGIEKSFSGCFLNSVVTTRNLLDAATRQSTLKRFVNTSTIAVYSNAHIPRGGLIDESSKVDTRWKRRYEAYTYGKAKQDEVILEYAQKYQLPFVIVRPSVVYGPGKAKITDRIGTNTFGIFLHLGLRNQIPLTYIDNCAEAIVLAGLKKGIDGQVFNIVDDDLPSSREFLRGYKRHVRRFISIPVPYAIWYLFNAFWEKYSKWSDGQLPPVYNRTACAIYWKGNTYSNSKAKEMLGWRQRIPTQVALMKFFDYMSQREKRV